MIDDGVVKYSLEFESDDALILDESVEIEEVREDMFLLGLIGAYSNGIGYGNISMRHKKNQFVITATQTGEKERLLYTDYSLVTQVNFNTFTATAKGASKPSSEAITHACIYELDTNINAIIHIHNEKIWNFMLKNDYLSTNDTPYGTPEMVDDIRSIYKDIEVLTNNAFVMKGHFEGVVTFGKNLYEAKKALYTIVNTMMKN